MSATPYKLNELTGEITDCDGARVGYLVQTGYVVGREIINACNAHADLVKALKDARDQLSYHDRSFSCDIGADLDEIDAALAKAGVL
jgi:hypothetical protein